MNDYRPEVRSLFKTLSRHGFSIVAVNNGEQWVRYSDVSKTEFLDETVASDEANLRIRHNNKTLGIYLVYGNEPGVIAADYTDYDPLEVVIDEHYNRWENRKQPTC